jgi:hypothetical protein
MQLGWNKPRQRNGRELDTLAANLSQPIQTGTATAV